MDGLVDFPCGDPSALALSVDQGCWWLVKCDVALHLDAEHQLVAGSAHGVGGCACCPCAYPCAAGAAIVLLCGDSCYVLACVVWWSCPVEDVVKFCE